VRRSTPPGRTPTRRPGSTADSSPAPSDDIAVANRLAAAVFGHALDELAPQTRRLLTALDAQVAAISAERGCPRSAVRFTRRELRAWTGWSDFQVHVHLTRLVALDYVIAHGRRRSDGFGYELLYDGQGEDGAPFVLGLVDVAALPAAVAALPHGYDAPQSPTNGDRTAPWSPHPARLSPFLAPS